MFAEGTTDIFFFITTRGNRWTAAHGENRNPGMEPGTFLLAKGQVNQYWKVRLGKVLSQPCQGIPIKVMPSPCDTDTTLKGKTPNLTF